MFDLITISSLEKVLPKRDFDCPAQTELSILKGETASFQLAFATDKPGMYSFTVESDTVKDIEVFRVDNIPVGLACFDWALKDEGYISKDSCVMPDMLTRLDSYRVQALDVYRSVWINVRAEAGEHLIKIAFYGLDGEKASEAEYKITVLPAELPEQELIYTQWFHTDCISEYYGFDMFSEEHWDMTEKFLRMAVESGINMIFTPIFTPPLDTEVGTKRPPAQLLGIVKKGDEYIFDFTNVKRWIRLCKEIGFKYFEMPHLFTQWGAKATPCIMAEVDGVTKDIFGWDIPALSAEYEAFLAALIPALRTVLKEEGVLENTYFHISDEPEHRHLEEYTAARNMAKKYLADFKIIDALSAFEFYESGVADIPVPASNSVEPFLNAQLSERWVYYCCVQGIGVSNRFVSMPAARNRSIGLQMFKYNIDGFLHWGYNFYYSQYSRRLLNPFLETDADGAFPTGDSYTVYPGKEGPIPSTRMYVFKDALNDISALKLLEKYIGHVEAVALIEKTLGEEITFATCYTAEQIFAVRNAVNSKIAEFV